VNSKTASPNQLKALRARFLTIHNFRFTPYGKRSATMRAPFSKPNSNEVNELICSALAPMAQRALALVR
jgi:hypothetical protein